LFFKFVLYSFELLVICKSRLRFILLVLLVEFIALSSFIALSLLALGSFKIIALNLLLVQGISVLNLLLVLHINNLLGSTTLNSSL